MNKVSIKDIARIKGDFRLIRFDWFDRAIDL